ncbi:MAG: diaminopimelate epimerase [Bacteroidales bacterium]|nr:diaminopimelate epimerase [Bacteroidales bacterium]HOK99537.1 diaminopimelate epimerase [Bacteroidales bacterium]HPO66399.1 diaminopimelate epimerase [Bacteroidales bacterium]
MLGKNGFIKSHGLGNDYVVLDGSFLGFPINEDTIKKICDVHYGIGSDGILLYEGEKDGLYQLRIFNPDGSEAEKSGNGLRIFAKFLHDYGYVRTTSFRINTPGGIVSANIDKQIKGKATLVTIDMGKATFTAKDIPVHCPEKECFDYPLTIGDTQLNIHCVSVGNPHCVIFTDVLDEQQVRMLGPHIENHPMFPNRINVQFVKLISENEIEMLIWERGAGYTLASGSSSCAAVAVAYKKGITGKEVVVNMPGGKLIISLDNDWNIRLSGGVSQIAEGVLSDELVDELNSL